MHFNKLHILTAADIVPWLYLFSGRYDTGICGYWISKIEGLPHIFNTLMVNY